MKILQPTPFHSMSSTLLFGDLLLHILFCRADSVLVVLNPDLEHGHEKTADGYEEVITVRLPGEADGSFSRTFDLTSNASQEFQYDGKRYRITLKAIPRTRWRNQNFFHPEFEVAELS